MRDTVLQDVAYLFVEQYEELAEHYRRADVDLIRATADKGEAALYMVVATLFGPKLDQALLGAACVGTDYIAYFDETWDEMDTEQQVIAAELAELHLESVVTVARLSRNNACGVSDQIAAVCAEAGFHLQKIREKLKKGRGCQTLSHEKEYKRIIILSHSRTCERFSTSKNCRIPIFGYRGVIMNTSKKLIVLVLVLSMLAMGVCQAADGGWSINTTVKSLMNDSQARHALKKATRDYTGYKLRPLALLGTQVVSGVNYCMLCYGSTVTKSPSPSLCEVYVFENPQGKAKITKVRKIKLKGAPSSGWKLSKYKKALTVDRKVRSAMREATADLEGAEYRPLLVLGKASNAYTLLCRCRLIDAGRTTSLKIVAIRKKGGKYVIRRIDDLPVAR